MRVYGSKGADPRHLFSWKGRDYMLSGQHLDLEDCAKLSALEDCAKLSAMQASGRLEAFIS